jgi:hypothetical protein
MAYHLHYVCIVNSNKFKNIYFLYTFISFLFFLFPNLDFHLGFNPTSSNYYLITIILIILFNAQTYKTPTRCTFFYFSIIYFN